MKDKKHYIKQSAAWVEKFVIGLNLCPFAAKPFKTDKIRYKVAKEKELEALGLLVAAELQYLNNTPSGETETTLIIIPDLLNDFYDFLDFTEIAEQISHDLGLEGVFQIATFHPAYQFAGTEKEDVENYTNRSPFPMLHLLREESVSKASDTYPDIDLIPERNITRLRELGTEGVKKIIL